MKKEKVLLAYSGGLDTSVILRWLADEGHAVVAFTGDVGQREDFSGLEAKAKKSGAIDFRLADLKERFVTGFCWPSVQFHARYEGRYLLGTSLARPCLAEAMVQAALDTGCTAVAHGATGKGNDQVRFELTTMALAPELHIIAPWRDPSFYGKIKGRADAIRYAEERGIPIKAKQSTPWSCDENLFHLSFEAGILEDPAKRPPKEMFELSVAPQEAPSEPETVTIAFEKGLPVAVNGERLAPVALLTKLNALGGRHGVGRVDIVESRYVGMKSRGVYETPGGTLLMAAHHDLEGLTLDRDTIDLKETLMPRFARRVYEGYWHSPEMSALRALLAETQHYVTGEVSLELYKGNATVVSRKSALSLYDPAVATMDDDQGAYDPRYATGFIRLHGLGLKAHRKRLRKQ